MSPAAIKRFEIRLSGSGGQGVITLGKIMGEAFALGQGYYVTQTQSYGPEARGGSSRADLVVSSSRISYPKTEKLDLLVALTQEACNAYAHDLKPGGVLVVDSTLVAHAPTNAFLGLPFTELTRDKVKVPQAMNIMVMGALAHVAPFANPAALRQAVQKALPPKVHQANLLAFDLGLAEAEAAFGPRADIWRRAEENAAMIEGDDMTIVSEG